EKHGGLEFNAFNLDPFVYFVHKTLGFSGYGFSLDDDTADVSGFGATKFQMTVAGLNGLVNNQEWTIQTPYGPVNTNALFPTVIGAWDPTQQATFSLAISAVTVNPGQPVVITSVKHSLRDGDQVSIIAPGITINPVQALYTITNVTRDTFALQGT